MTSSTLGDSCSLGVAILAAGASTRMGRPKLLLPWGATTVLGHLVQQWGDLPASHLAVVCAAGDATMAGELDRLGFPETDRIINSAPELGMFGSIQCAARWNGWQPGLTHFAIVLGDQPQVKLATLRRLRDFAAAHPANICQPSRNARVRHPVVLPAAHFAALPETKDLTLRHFLERWSGGVVLCEIDDPGLDFDLDTPADYERARGMAKPGERN